MKRVNKQQGFTIIELLVAISMITFIASIAMVGMNTARARAQDTAAEAETRQIQRAMVTYSIEKEGYPNPVALNQGPYCIGGTNCMLAGVPITQKLETQGFEFPSISQPPAVSIGGLKTQGFIYLSCSSSASVCPNESVKILYPLSYGVVYRDPEGNSSVNTTGYCTGSNPVRCDSILYNVCEKIGCGTTFEGTCSSSDTIPCSNFNTLNSASGRPSQAEASCTENMCQWVRY